MSEAVPMGGKLPVQPGAAAKAGTAQPLPVWSCEFQPMDGAGAVPLDNLTVGSLFKMNCHGDIEVNWGSDAPIVAAFPKEDGAYTLYILKYPKLESRSAEFIVTAYKPGQHAPEYVRITQGQTGFEFVKPKWAVKSVLKQGEQPKPYPPFGPWNVSLPMWFWITIGVVVLALIYFVARKVRRHNQRSKMLAELQRHKTALSPLHQFYRDARIIRRRLHNVKQTEELNDLSLELNREFRLYVLRQFEIPTLDWSDREIVRDLKKRHRKVYYRVRDPLRKTLRELGRLAVQKQILFKDIEQLHRMSLETVEKIDSARGGGR